MSEAPTPEATVVIFTKVARMTAELRKQFGVDAMTAQADDALMPRCAWPGCTHRALYRYPAGSMPAFECEPHKVHGTAYEEVRPQAAVTFAALQAAAGAFAHAGATTPATKDMGKRMLLDGVRGLVNHLTKPKGT